MKTTPNIFLDLQKFLSSGRQIVPIILGIILVVGVLGWGEYRRGTLWQEVMSQKKDYSALASSTEHANLILSDLELKIATLTSENVALSGIVYTEQGKNDAIQEQVGKVSSTVGALDKLSKTDPQLLQKYSKIFFLNEHFTPASLSTITPEFTFEKNKNYQINSGIASKLDGMLRASKSDGLTLLVISAYRSFGMQETLKTSYKMTFGATKANQFSADQGYSEHQLGTTLDFTTPKGGAVLEGFDKTPEFMWLTTNAYKYGFIMSYPKGNTYYMYEPWHWRYVGVDLAERLHRDNQNFYDLDQRTIDNYLLLLFN